jgi:hypothetical protein
MMDADNSGRHWVVTESLGGSLRIRVCPLAQRKARHTVLRVGNRCGRAAAPEALKMKAETASLGADLYENRDAALGAFAAKLARVDMRAVAARCG